MTATLETKFLFDKIKKIINYNEREKISGEEFRNIMES